MSDENNNTQEFSEADKEVLDAAVESIRGQNDDTQVSGTVKLEQEIADLTDKLTRSVAEAENTRKRFQQQLNDNSKFAVADFAKSLVDVFEDFFLLVTNAPNAGDVDEKGFESFISGVKLTHQNLEKSLQQFGIERIYPLEQKFDHNLHQAITQVEDDSEAGTVVQVIRAGYRINGRLLKEALVAISKGR